MRKTAISLCLLILIVVPALGGHRENPHNFQAVGCTHCHLLVPGSSLIVKKKVFRRNIDSLCQECHEAALEDNLNHSVGIRPSMNVPEDLHLSRTGEISCITCHDPHAEYLDIKTSDRTYFLRRGMLKRELCLACHSSGNYRPPSNTFDLLAPTNDSIISSLPAPLIGKVTDPTVKEVKIEINDSNFMLNVRRSVFSTILTLQEGTNTIRLSTAGVTPLSVNLFYNPNIAEEMTYKIYRSHGIATKKDCTLCHETSSPSYRIDEDNSILCNKCHEEKGDKTYVHGPVAVGSCTVCHDPHGQANRALLIKAEEDLCFDCHSADNVLKHLLTPDPELRSLLRDKGCGFCHDPHDSERKFLLRSRF